MKILLQKLFHPIWGSSIAATVAVELESDVRRAVRRGAFCAWHHKYDKRLTYLLPRAESGEGEPYWLAVVLVIN